MLIFDPTNVHLVNVVPYCSQMHLVLALFRGAWKKIEEVFERAVAAVEDKADGKSISGAVEECTDALLGAPGEFLQALFGLSDAAGRP